MNMTTMHTEHDVQIGGPAGYVAQKVADAQLDAARALDLVRADWTNPGPGLHPREAALAAAREAVLHLNEALKVEAPRDAVEDTRHALEALNGAIAVLDKMGNNPPIVPGKLPVANFEQAINKLVEAEAKLQVPVGWGLENVAHGLKLGVEPVDPDTPHIMAAALPPNGNPGTVPPWLQ